MSPIAFDQEQVQKLTEIGAHLRNIRTQKRVSLEDVSAKTMIQQRFLDAIEQGQPENLPEALYVRGFIRRYAEMLGLNGVQLSETFPLGRESLASSNANFLSTSGTALRPWHLYIFYTALIVAAGMGLSYIVSRQSAPRTEGSNVSAPSAPAPAPSKLATKIKPAVAKPKPADSVQAKLTLKADSYVEITADGKSAYVGNLKAGSAKTFTAKKEIQLFTGNAGGVLLGVNNQVAKTMGKNGEVKEVVLTPKSE
jgi:transcriptional regulator with XRE-family HTH domain